LLLEYLQPGTPLSKMENDERATEIAAQAVLSGCWSIEDNDLDWKGVIRVAEEIFDI
jgi:hypothetical protein